MAKVLIGYSRCAKTREAFERQGHHVMTCDLLPADQPNHLQMDIREALFLKAWDFAVLHPMCTYLTVSAAWAFKDPDFDKYPGVGYHQKVKPGTLTGAARRAQREIELDNFRWLDCLPFPTVKENPGVSFINKAIRPPNQIIHPHQFGDDASKATGLWMTGNVPHLRATAHYAPRVLCASCGSRSHSYGEFPCQKCKGTKYVKRWANQTDSGQNNLSPSDDRWLDRSATYPGIAAAMGDQWGRWLNERIA